MIRIIGTYVDIYAGQIPPAEWLNLMDKGISEDEIMDRIDELEHISSGIDATNVRVYIDDTCAADGLNQLIEKFHVSYRDDLQVCAIQNDQQRALSLIEYSKLFFNDQNINELKFELRKFVFGDGRNIVLLRPFDKELEIDLSDDIECQSFSALLISHENSADDCEIY